jgi:hypothetical protein
VILGEWERERTRQTIEAFIEQEQLKAALQRSLVVSCSGGTAIYGYGLNYCSTLADAG